MKAVTITTINVAENLYRIKEALPDFVPVVVGDLRTPHEANRRICHELGGIYLDPQTQTKLGFTHAAAMEWNSYGRKNIAYLYALKEGATVLYTTDDDNVPQGDWRGHTTLGPQAATVAESATGWYNYYAEANGGLPNPFSPRGYPWWRLPTANSTLTTRRAEARVGVIAGLHLGDPDVDTITRMTRDCTVNSYPETDVVLAKGTMSPYDTQNTFITRELMPANMLWSYQIDHPCGGWCSRYDDIHAGYIGQVIGWKWGYSVRFGRPFAHQNRNPHDPLRDITIEIDGMRSHDIFIDTLLATPLTGSTVLEDFLIVGKALLAKVPGLPKTLRLYLDTWASDLRSIGIE